MLTIILITIICATLYYSGVVRKILIRLKLEDSPLIVDSTKEENENNIMYPKEKYSNLNRKELEKKAACILTCEGCKGDVFGMVRTLTDNELIQILEYGY